LIQFQTSVENIYQITYSRYTGGTSINLVHLEYQNDVAPVVQKVDNAIHWINTLANGGKELLGPWRPNGHHDYGTGAGAVENAVDLSTFFFFFFNFLHK